MADHGSTVQDPAAPPATAGPDNPRPEEMISTGEAAAILGHNPRTVERWIDARPQKLRGGRPSDPATREPILGSHRWVDAGHAVALAVGAGRAHLIPEKWRYLIPQTAVPSPRSQPPPGD